MPRQITEYRLFIASPGGLQDERMAFRDAINTYNHAEAIPRAVFFIPVGWEDTLGGVGRPQTLINEEIRTCDVFVLVLWDRWGTPPSDEKSRYTSGTEEEFALAQTLFCDEQAPMKQIIIFFKSVDANQLSDPGAQLRKVLRFRKKLEAGKSFLFHTFDSTERFEALLRRHLAVLLLAHEEGIKLDDLPRETFSGRADWSGDSLPNGLINLEFKYAGRLIDEGHRTEAERVYASAIAQGTDPRAFLEFGNFLLDDGRVGQARVMYARARELAQASGDEVCLAEAMRSLGNVLTRCGYPSDAEEFYTTALGIDQKLMRLEGISIDYASIGEMLWWRGDIFGAEEMHRKSLEIETELECLEGMARQYTHLGEVYHARGELVRAEKMYRTALTICQNIAIPRCTAQNLTNLGRVFELQGDTEGAEENFRKALELNEEIGLLIPIAHSCSDLGRMLSTCGDLSGSEALHRRALQIYKTLGWLLQATLQCFRLGDIFHKRRLLFDAMEMFRKAVEWAEIAENTQEIGIGSISLGDLALEQGDRPTAFKYYEQAILAFEQIEANVAVSLARQRLEALSEGNGEGVS